VDAECSTDGSLKHIRKQILAATKNKKQQQQQQQQEQHAGVDDKKVQLLHHIIMDHDQFQELVELQKKLAASGFRLLKPGGVMIYSTCSMMEEQNQQVVKWLLQEFSNSFIIPISFHKRFHSNKNYETNNNDGVESSCCHDTGHVITEDEYGIQFHPYQSNKNKNPIAATMTTTATTGLKLLPSQQQQQQEPQQDSSKIFFGGGFFLAKIGKRKEE